MQSTYDELRLICAVDGMAFTGSRNEIGGVVFAAVIGAGIGAAFMAVELDDDAVDTAGPGFVIRCMIVGGRASSWPRREAYGCRSSPNR